MSGPLVQASDRQTGEPSAPAKRLGAITRLDSSAVRPEFLLECPNGARLRVSPTVRAVLEGRWNGLSFEQISDSLRAQELAAASPAEVEAYYVKATEKIMAANANYSAVPRGYSLRFPLLSQPVVEAVSSRLTWMYSPWVAGLALIAALAGILVWLCSNVLGATHAPGSAGAWLAAYTLYLLSLGCHEFGHASAAVRFGTRPGAIGFILYLTFPALYSDVSATWALPRAQRAIVGLAGTYFQIVVGAVYVLLYTLTHWLPLAIAMWMIVATSLFNLNPLFKFDGYWVVSDVLGVPNLAKTARRALLGRERTRHWPLRTVLFLIAYGVLAIGLWTWFVARLVQYVPYALGAEWRALHELGRGGTHAFEHAFFGFLGLLFVALFAFRLARQVIPPWVSRARTWLAAKQSN